MLMWFTHICIRWAFKEASLLLVGSAVDIFLLVCTKRTPHTSSGRRLCGMKEAECKPLLRLTIWAIEHTRRTTAAMSFCSVLAAYDQRTLDRGTQTGGYRMAPSLRISHATASQTPVVGFVSKCRASETQACGRLRDQMPCYPVLAPSLSRPHL